MKPSVRVEKGRSRPELRESLNALSASLENTVTEQVHVHSALKDRSLNRLDNHSVQLVQMVRLHPLIEIHVPLPVRQDKENNLLKALM